MSSFPCPTRRWNSTRYPRSKTRSTKSGLDLGRTSRTGTSGWAGRGLGPVDTEQLPAADTAQRLSPSARATAATPPSESGISHAGALAATFHGDDASTCLILANDQTVVAGSLKRLRGAVTHGPSTVGLDPDDHPAGDLLRGQLRPLRRGMLGHQRVQPADAFQALRQSGLGPAADRRTGGRRHPRARRSIVAGDIASNASSVSSLITSSSEAPKQERQRGNDFRPADRDPRRPWSHQPVVAHSSSRDQAPSRAPTRAFSDESARTLDLPDL